MTEKIVFTVSCDARQVSDVFEVLREDNAKLRDALRTIVKWEDFPDTGKFWDEEKTKPMPYSACFGSAGERDHMRRIAADALGGGDEVAQTILFKMGIHI